MNPKITLSSSSPDQQRADVLAICVIQERLKTDPILASINAKLDGYLHQIVARAEFVGRVDQVLEIPTLGHLPAQRLVLVGVGEAAPFEEHRLRALAATVVRQGTALGGGHVALAIPHKLSADAFRCLAEGVILGGYRFDRFLTGERRPKHRVDSVTILTPERAPAAAKVHVELGRAAAQGVCLARDAVNEPPNELTPAVLARRASELARKGILRTRVLDAKGIERQGMKLLSAVGRGSRNEPRFIHMSYTPRQRSKKRVVLLGKGLTFDSGGLCIKPAAGMNEMKSDMGGAAAVLGVMSILPTLLPPIEVHGLIVAAENMPDGAAYRPGDVFGSLDGRTVEIVNTDAEGRLALADGLAYARGLRPDMVVDVATLTGACVVALGRTTSAYFTTSDELAGRFELAARSAGESFWRMPFLADLRDQLKSDVADLKHTGERFGGAITAALFLKEFVGQIPYIHCDIAGPVLSERVRGVLCKGATGHPVLTLVRFLEMLG